ncbi:PBS lyase, partial [Streptomyces cavourensis]|nr:PBS lyase [Streptomyces cavourensis]
MFSGIDEVDWASMEHAYGPADDVPTLLRGLASADPAERESALDGMYGAVHHQGDVYACTLACIPFLFELAVDPGVQDRGSVVELLTSIGGFDLDEDDEEIDEDEIEGAANYAMAAAAVTAGAGVFFELIADEDPGVRLAAPLALATLHRHPVRVLALLRERLPVEPDEEVRLALVEAAGRIALRHRPLAGQVAQWLTLLVGRERSPGLRLAALAQLARCSPDALPRDVVPVVSGLLRELRARPGAGATDPEHEPYPRQGLYEPYEPQHGPYEPQHAYEPHEPLDPDGEPDPDAEAEPEADPVGTADASRAEQAAPTLVGQLRALSAQENAGRGAPWAADLLRTLHVGLDDRVGDRTALLVDQLRSPDRWQRIDAVRMSGGLIRAWRGSYEELVGLVGDQLSDPDPRLAEAASHVLEELFSLAAPTADALAARLAADPGGWVKEWASGPPGLGARQPWPRGYYRHEAPV